MSETECARVYTVSSSDCVSNCNGLYLLLTWCDTHIQ